MVQWIIYGVRAAAAFIVSAIGLILLVSVLASNNRTAWTIGVSLAMTAGGLLAWPRRPNAWRRDPPTDRQIAYATDLGIDIPPWVSKGELSDLISRGVGR
jgi:hypothetical protein